MPKDVSCQLGLTTIILKFQSEGEERIREAVVATFKSYRMSGNASNHLNVAQQYATCDVATDKLDLAAEHIKTQNGESADIAKVITSLRVDDNKVKVLI
jgi:hypothetical protein